MELWLSQKGQGRLLKEVFLELRVEGCAGGVSQINSRGKRCRQTQHGQRSRDKRDNGRYKLLKAGQHIWSRKSEEGKSLR